jgi:hypothetical protein
MSTKKSVSRMFSVLFVAVSLLALMFSAIGVTPAHADNTIVGKSNPNSLPEKQQSLTTAITPLDGAWSGTTNQPRAVSFTVISSGTQWSTFTLAIYVAACGLTMTNYIYGPGYGPGAITNGQFSGSGSSGAGTVSFAGTFTSTTTASGTFSYVNYPISGCGTLNASGTWTASIPLPLPGNFTKSGPANGAVDQSTNPTLTWGTSSNADSYEYCIDTSECSDDSLLWVSTGANNSANPTNLDGNTTYYWQVRAHNATGNTYADSDVWWSFTTHPVYTLTYTAGLNGSITAPATSPTSHSSGTSVTITAVPVAGYHFVNWTGDVSTVANVNAATTTITMNGDYSITANFAIDTHTLTYSVVGNGAVTAPVDPSPVTYNYGDIVPITAVPDAGYHFVNWTGDVSTVDDVNAADTTITMNGDYSITANFAIDTITVTVSSTNSQDGWVLESGETTSKGGTMNSTATTFRLGDDKAKKQYRGILSFSTKGLPDDAAITKVTLKVRKQGIIGGGNPITTFQGFMVDIKRGYFGTTALQTADFQTAASKTYGPFKPALSSSWYIIDLTSGKNYINKVSSYSGLTQIRLRFKLDDNNNTTANYLSLYSGNAGSAYRPQLVIEYYVP